MKSFLMATLISTGLLLSGSLYGAETQKQIKVGYPAIAPFFYMADGKPQGICYDMVQRIFPDAEQFITQEMPLNRLAKELISGDVDMAGCIPCPLPSLAGQVVYSDAYLRQEILLIIPFNSDKSAMATATLLEQYEGATIRGTIGEVIIKSSEIELVDSALTLLQFVHLERTNYGIIPKVVYEQLMTQGENMQRFKFSTRVIQTVRGCFAISKHSALLTRLETINSALKAAADTKENLENQDHQENALKAIK